MGLPPIDCKRVTDYITRRLRWYVFEYSGAKAGVIGVSGGVDSATTAFLATRALGKENVYCYILPSHATQEEDLECAREVIERLKIPEKNYETIPITPIVEKFKQSLGDMSKVEEGNIHARVRMIILHQRAYRHNALVIGTGDKSEITIGYFCYDSETRALTRNGLKRFYELKPGDVVFTLDLSTGSVYEVPVRGVYVFNYEGPMIHFLNNHVNLLVTPNHRMLVKEEDRLFFEEARNLLGSNTVYIPIPDIYLGTIKASMHSTLSLKGMLYRVGYKKVSAKDSYTIDYKGLVWCPDVPPEHNLLVERKGRFSFCGNTKYGDGGVDVLPIGGLYKTYVRQLASYLGVPERIIKKPSSPALWPGQTAEGELGISYDLLDTILYLRFEEWLEEDEVAKRAGVSLDTVKRIMKMIKATQHKRLPPEIFKVGFRDHGSDWRYPRQWM